MSDNEQRTATITLGPDGIKVDDGETIRVTIARRYVILLDYDPNDLSDCKLVTTVSRTVMHLSAEDAAAIEAWILGGDQPAMVPVAPEPFKAGDRVIYRGNEHTISRPFASETDPSGPRWWRLHGVYRLVQESELSRL
jgi:hypothetical protein